MRLIDAEQTKAGCTLVGKVEPYKRIVLGGMPAAQLRVREKVAKAGGNAHAVTSQYPGPHGLFDIKPTPTAASLSAQKCQGSGRS